MWHRDDNSFPSTERSGRETNQRSSTGKPGREVQNQLTEVKLNYHNLEISNIRYIEKVFANVRHKLNRPEDDQTVLDQRVNVLTRTFELAQSTSMTPIMGCSKLLGKVKQVGFFQAVVSRAAFRRVPRNGKPNVTLMSLHINNHNAKGEKMRREKRGEDQRKEKTRWKRRKKRD